MKISAEVMVAIDKRAAAEFGKRSEAASKILEKAVACDTGAAPSPMADMKERSTSLDLELKETRLAQIRKELLTVDAAIAVVEDVLGGMRTEGLQLMDDIATDFGLDAKELRRSFLKTMAGPFSVEREPLQQLADDFAKQSLPT